MAQKGSKKRDITLDEEKDVFLSFINKRVRNSRKKLEQIDELAKKDKDTLKPEQLEKINSKSEVLETVRYFDKIKDLYYEALKTAREEGRADAGEQKKEEIVKEVIVEKSVPVQQTVSTSETSLKILNLVYFAQLYSDQTKRERNENVDYDAFYDFYTRVFTISSERDRFEKIGHKISNAHQELELYLNNSDNTAVRNRSYRHLQDTVERIVATTHFRDQKADINTHTVNHSAQSAIGSELRQEKATEEHRAPEAKIESPVKTQEPRPENIPTSADVERQQQEERQRQQQEQQQQTHQEQHQGHHHQRQHHTHNQQHHQHHHQQHEKKQWADIEEPEETKVQESKNVDENEGFFTVQAKKKKVETHRPRGGPRRPGQGGHREGGNREGGNREGGNREGGNKEGGYKGHREGGHREGGNREGGNRGPREGGQRNQGQRNERNERNERQYVPKNVEKKTEENTEQTKAV